MSSKLAPGLAQKLRKVLEARVDPPKLLVSQMRRNLRSTIEKQGLSVNEEFLRAEAAQKIRRWSLGFRGLSKCSKCLEERPSISKTMEKMPSGVLEVKEDSGKKIMEQLKIMERLLESNQDQQRDNKELHRNISEIEELQRDHIKDLRRGIEDLSGGLSTCSTILYWLILTYGVIKIARL